MLRMDSEDGFGLCVECRRSPTEDELAQALEETRRKTDASEQTRASKEGLRRNRETGLRELAALIADVAVDGNRPAWKERYTDLATRSGLSHERVVGVTQHVCKAAAKDLSRESLAQLAYSGLTYGLEEI